MSAQSELRLDVRGVAKRYGAVHALRDVDLQLRAGEVMALLGENGAGKSTIVKVLSGLVHPDQGAIHIDGELVMLSSSDASQQAGIAVVQQEYSTIGSLSVAENLLLGQRDSRVVWSGKYLRKNAEDLLARVGLSHVHPATLVEHLSVAEMQLLEIARVLARDAKIVIFDEPTAALSDAEIVRVLEVVRNLASEGRSIIYVTHRLNEVFEIADRVTVFRNGRSQTAVSAKELDVATIIEMMLGRELGDMYPSRSGGFGEALLDVRGLRTTGARDGVSFTSHRGEIIGFTGQLGSGASDVLQALAGMVPALAGEATLDGESFAFGSRRSGIRAGVAYCSADRKRNGIFAGISIQQNLSSPWLPKVARGGIVSPRAERAAATRISEEFAIDAARLASNVGSLSGGNQQKVALGKWLGINPRLILVDEPTRGVDVGARSEIYRQLRELCDAGLSVVVASSDTNEILGLCDTVGTFYRGRLTALKPATEWTEHELVRQVMHTTEDTHVVD